MADKDVEKNPIFLKPLPNILDEIQSAAADLTCWIPAS